MNKRQDPRIASNCPINLHFYGEQVDVSLCKDYSDGGFFVQTSKNLDLDKGVVALVTIDHGQHARYQCLAEVVRLTDEGAGFQIIDKTLDAAC